MIVLVLNYLNLLLKLNQTKESLMTMQTIHKIELDILSQFNYFVQQAQSAHGEDANIIKVDYDGELDDFEVTTAQKTKRRVSKLTADVIHWVSGQLDIFAINSINLQKLYLAYENNTFNIDIILKLQETQVAENTQEASE